MKTINSKKVSARNESPSIFIDDVLGIYNGFAGKVTVYDEDIYVNTKNGIGYDKVINKLARLIHRLAVKYRFNGNMVEDTKQDIIIHILEGIPKYDPRKNTKLSTFLEILINRRLINELRNISRVSRNATYLNIGTFNITCECGYSFITILDSNETKKCTNCRKLISSINKKMSINIPEINESVLSSTCSNNIVIDDYAKVIKNNEKTIDENVIFMHDMRCWLNEEDPRIAKIVELIYFDDYSITAAANEVGLSSGGANMKLKELSKNKKVKELFGR